MNNMKMLYFDRNEVSEGNDINKSSISKEYNICHYLCFLKKWFKIQQYVCNKCHDLLKMFMKLSGNAILKIKNINYCCIVTGVSKCDTIKL